MKARTGKKISVVEDGSLSDVVLPALEEAGYQVQASNDGLEGLRQFYNWRPDLVILGVAVPRMDGWTVCQRIREVSDTPILMLTEKASESREVRALQEGADIYMAKPFSIPLLLARVEALLRHRDRPSRASQRKVIKVGKLKVDLLRYEATLGGQSLHLTPTEFRLLAAMATRAGEVVTHRELLEQVWGADGESDDLYLKLYICYLRKKIEDNPEQPLYIRTKRRVGYLLCDGGSIPRGRGLGRGSVTGTAVGSMAS